MARLRNFVDRISIISLPHRSERRDTLVSNLEATGLASPDDLTWIEAVDGRKDKPPAWWKAGEGAWGCRESHLKAINQAQADGLKNILILEDDAVFHEDAGQFLSELFSSLPPHWELFFLGGQHLVPPSKTAHPLLLKGHGISRTHAYVASHRAFSKFRSLIAKSSPYHQQDDWHLDHYLAHLQREKCLKAYAPSWWLAGQEASHSDISYQHDHCRWWQPGNDYLKIPFIIIPRELAGSKDLYCAPEDPPLRAIELALWFRETALGAWLRGCLPSCDLSADLILKYWSAGVKSVSTSTELANLTRYPMNGLFVHPFNLSKSQLI